MAGGGKLWVTTGAPFGTAAQDLSSPYGKVLGYKHAKYLIGIEAVASLDGIGRGKGGYWEDRASYQWYAGI